MASLKFNWNFVGTNELMGNRNTGLAQPLLTLEHGRATHYDDVIMDWIASQITSLPVVCSIVYSGVNQRKHQSSASLAFVREIHRGPVNFPHKWPVTRKMFTFDDVIMYTSKIHSGVITYPVTIVPNVTTKIAQHAHARMFAIIVEKSPNSSNLYDHGFMDNTNRQAVCKSQKNPFKWFTNSRRTTLKTMKIHHNQLKWPVTI